MKLEDLLKEMAEEESGLNLPDWFSDFASYLSEKDQLILFVDEHDSLSGFVFLWKYGKDKFKFVRESFSKGLTQDKNITGLTRGPHIYIPLASARRDRQVDFLDNVLETVVRKFPDIKSVTYHDNTGQFHIIKLGG